MGDGADDALERADSDDWNSICVSSGQGPNFGYDEDEEFTGPVVLGQPFTVNGEMAQYHLGQDDQDDAMAQEQEDPEPAPVMPQTARCPKCGGKMHIATVRETGSRFLGCNNYPRCHGSRPMPVNSSTMEANTHALKMAEGIGRHAKAALEGRVTAVEHHLKEIQQLVQNLKGRLNAKT